MFDYEKLDLYQRVRLLTKEIYKFVNASKCDIFLKDQLKRAVISIQLNLAEGTGRNTKNDQRRFYVIARSSVFETVSILQLFLDLELLQKKQFDLWYNEYDQLSRMLLALQRSRNKIEF